MSQKTILFAGCSFTSDCGFTETNRLQYHWPELFCKHFNCSSQNIAIGGSSNEEIFLRAVEHTIDTKVDLVVVMWSAIGRKWIYCSDRNIDDYTAINFGNLRGFNCSSDEVKDYAKMHYAYFNNEYMNLKHWLISAIALANYFESRQQPYVFARGFENCVDDFENLLYDTSHGFLNVSDNTRRLLKIDNNPDYLINNKAQIIKDLINHNKNLNWNNLLTPGFYESRTDYADDLIHPGIKTNQLFCNQLIDYCTREKLL